MTEAELKEIIPGSAPNDLDWYFLDHYFQQNYELLPSKMDEEEKIQLLENADILKPGPENQKFLSLAGLLTFGINPSRHLKSAYITLAHYHSQHKDSELLDRKDIHGRLSRQVDETVDMLMNRIPVPSSIEGTKRVDRYPVPKKVIRELVANSVCHRDYSMQGTQVIVNLFSDRLEISTPGALPNTMTVDKMKAGKSAARYPNIVKFMENLGYMDKLGRGIPMVIREMKKLGAQEPQILDGGNDLTIEVYFPPGI